jgi:CubicO group peptidase (beta-lactamase class C family)
MEALRLVTTWPVDHVAAAAITSNGTETIGETDRMFRLASLAKVLTSWAVLVAVEEGAVDLDAPLRHVTAPDGSTLRHLLAHAAGFGFDGDAAVSEVGRRRIYSNTGIERAAEELADSTGIEFPAYLTEAVLEPLGMTRTEVRGSPAHGIWSTLADMVRFVDELRTPRVIIARSTWTDATTNQFPALAGTIPGLGRFDPCPWGLGPEIRDAKSPHWTGRTNSPATFGHFGGAGTMMWVDPVADVGLVALTDRPFDEWSHEALQRWPELSDAVLSEIRTSAG